MEHNDTHKNKNKVIKHKKITGFFKYKLKYSERFNIKDYLLQNYIISSFIYKQIDTFNHTYV